MSTRIHLNNRTAFIVAVAVAGALVGLATFATSPFDIEFPILELGNCADRESCKVYCDEPEHADACDAFAARHGFGTSDELKEETDALVEDGGPGGCAEGSKNPRRSCEAYCGKRENMRQCVAYARDHGLMDEDELDEAEKVIEALDRGVKLPAACEDERSCKETCENPPDLETARQCFAFAEEAGLLPDDVDSEQAEALFSAIEEGRIPFKSFAEMRQCDDPPSDEVLQMCIQVGIELGMIDEEEAEMIKKTGGKGPGGCRGRNECEAYCEKHQEECFKFAEEHDLISDEDRERMEEGVEEMRSALEDAPEGARECMNKKLGAVTLDEVFAGRKFPSPAMGEAMRQCFEEAWRGMEGEERNFMMGGEDFGNGEFGPEQGLDARGGMIRGGEVRGPRGPQFPPEVAACLRERFGEEFLKKIGSGRPSPDMEAKMGECFKEAFGEGGDDHAPLPGGMGEGFRGKEFRGSEDDMMEREEGWNREYGDEFQKKYNQQYQEEFQKQYQEEYRRQYEIRSGDGGQPMPGGMYPGGGEGYQPPPGSFSPPPPSAAPPPPMDAPQSFRPGDRAWLLSNIYYSLFGF